MECQWREQHGRGLSIIILLLQQRMNERKKAIQTSDEVGHRISADYRRHFEEMRDSSVATSPAQRCPFLSSISFGQRKRNGQKPGKGCGTPFNILA